MFLTFSDKKIILIFYFLNKPYLKLSDLAHKQAKLIDRKIMNYPRLIIAIATFYVLPVVQLVFLYQTVSEILTF